MQLQNNIKLDNLEYTRKIGKLVDAYYLLCF